VITNTGIGRLGRLGNQIFQYAALLGIGERLDLPVAVPPLEQHGLGDLFCMTTDCYTPDDLRALRHEFHEAVHTYDPAWTGIRDATDLHGYFQSARYFPEAGSLARRLTFRPGVEAAADGAIRALRRDRPVVVGLTVRRGDYLINDEFIDLTSTPFYGRSIDRLEAELARRGVDPDDVVYALSSDDPTWCHRWRIGRRSTVIDHAGDRALSDLDQLAVLTRCDHLIIANSTYSWWAAWLNTVADRIVVAAEHWYTPDGLYPDHVREPLPDGWLYEPVDDLARRPRRRLGRRASRPVRIGAGATGRRRRSSTVVGGASVDRPEQPWRRRDRAVDGGDAAEPA
jgi:hypothetical protein